MDRIRIAALPALLVASFGLGGCRQKPPLTQPQIIATAPGGTEVGLEELRDGVRVTFDRPAAPSGALGRIIRGAAFKIEPALPGDARWLDLQTLGFFPRGPLRRSTGYAFSLAPDLELAAGLRLPDWKGMRIVYARLAVEDVAFQGWREHQPQRPLVTVRASQPLSPETAAAACGFVEKKAGGGEGRRAPAMIAGARPRPDGGTPEERDQDLAAALASGRAVRLEPTEPLAIATSYVLRCGPGLRPRDGGEGLAKDHDQAFTTYGPAGIKTIEPNGRDIAADGVPIKIEFTTPMDPTQVRQRVHLRSPAGPVGALDLAANYRRTVFTWSGDLEPGNSYQLVIEKGLVDAFGQPIEQERRHDFRVGDASPRLEAETGIYTVERSSGRYPMWTRNLTNLEVRCAAVPEARLTPVLTGPANYDAWWDAASRGSVDWKQLGLGRRTVTLRPDAARNRWHDQTLDLASTCGAPAVGADAATSGVYLLELVTDEERNREGHAARRERRSLVNVTDLGLLAKVGNASSLVWVVRLSTGAPVAGAAVAIRDVKGHLRFSGTSNADGVVQAPGAAKLTGRRPATDSPSGAEGEEGEWEDYRARRVVVTARAGDDLAVLDTNWNNGIQNWNFGVNEDRHLRQQRVRGFLHSDRGLYRPGDTVHLRGIVRALDKMAAMTVPRAGKVHLVIEDPRGATIEESDLPVSAFGGFHRDLALPAEARLGDWRARATLAGTTITERFSVEEYRARTFEVKLKTPRRHGFLGQPLAFEVQADFLYGSPLAGGKLDWNVRRRRYMPRFEGWDEYTFQDFASLADQGLWWARDEERSFSDTVADGQMTLDPAGRARIETRDVTPGEGPQDYLFEATVTDSSGQAVTSGTTLTAHAADLYLGLHPAEMVQAAEMPFAVQVVAFDTQGKRRAATVELILTRRQYDCGLGKGSAGNPDGWGCRRKDDPKPAVRKTVSVPASGTAAVERVVLAEPGEYVVEVSAKHGRGGRSVASDLVYVVGKGEAFWSGDEGERMTLIASRPRYRPGDTARLVPQTQLGQALALVSLERDGVLSYRLQSMASSGEAIEIPIDRQLAPNVFASVVLVRGRSGEGDRGRPRFKMGMVNLEVDASQRRLQVSVTPERPAYRPGELVRATLKVISEGTPVRAELAVAAADEGVLQILGYRTPDPLPAFYAPYALGVDSATTWNRLLRAKDPSKVDEEDSEEGGDGGGDEAGRVRSRFVATAFWNPAVVTGADGTAQISFPAPDNLTAFRLMAVAADKGDRFGSGEARFTINKPLQAVPALPRFLSLGDQAQAAVTLHNNESAAARVDVTLSASGVELAGPASQSLDLPARSHRQAVFAVRATRPGKAAFTFRASGGGHTDAVVVEIPVVQAVVRSSELVAEGATSGRIEASVPPARGALADRSGLEVVLDRTGLGRVSEGFGYLIGYPYGCLEQTTSKVVPMVALSELIDAGALGGGDHKGAEERIRGFVRAGIAKILRHQNDDGGFGLWIGAGSELHYTAYALWGLEIARRGGYPSEARATQDGVRYLKARLQAKPSAGGGALEIAGETGTRAFVHHVLAELGQGDVGALGALFERRRELPVYGRTFLLRALVKTERLDQARTLAGELLALIPGSTGPAIVKEGAGLDWYWSSDVRTTALLLLALLEGGATSAGSPGHAAIARLTQGLLGARSEGRWSSTQENVYGLTALAALARSRAGGAPVRVMVSVGGQGQGQAQGQGSTRTVTLAGTAIEHIKLPLPPPGSGPLVISAAGGEVFYAARLHLERPVSPDALDAGLAIRREYLDPDSGATLGRLKLGQAVKVRLTVVSPGRLAHVAVVDHLPAGLEPVLTRFRRSQMDGPGQDEERPVWWGPSWKTSWQHQELRDDRALVFADVLAAGESRHEYLARATTAGQFVMPPATSEAMYRPELHGRSTGGTLVIER